MLFVDVLDANLTESNRRSRADTILAPECFAAAGDALTAVASPLQPRRGPARRLPGHGPTSDKGCPDRRWRSDAAPAGRQRLSAPRRRRRVTLRRAATKMRLPGARSTHGVRQAAAAYRRIFLQSGPRCCAAIRRRAHPDRRKPGARRQRQAGPAVPAHPGC